VGETTQKGNKEERATRTTAR